MVFKRKRREEPVIPAPPRKPFHESLREWLDELDWYERSCSLYLPTETYSRLRFISDMVRESLPFLQVYSIRAEEEYILEQTLKDYIPNALRLFTQLSDEDRREGSEPDRQLHAQCVQFENSLTDLIRTMEKNVRDELANHATFVENRFAIPV